jgi:hypothetical protein
MCKAIWSGFALIATFGFSSQAQAFDQPVSVTDLRTHLGYYRGNAVTLEAVVDEVRYETRYIPNWENGIDIPITVYLFDLTDASGSMTVESRKAPETGLMRVRAEIVNGGVVVYEMQRIRPPCVTASC